MKKSYMSVKWFAAIMSLILIFSFFPSAHAEGSFTSANYNGRTYKIYVPGGYQPANSVPLVVMLHGCTQDPDQFAMGTQMNALAEIHNFIVIYPEQPFSANSSKCWNWFDPAHQSRGSGEPALIVGMVNQVKSQYSIDSNRIYVAGLSAGAAMAVILGATYPDVFAAINVSSGLEYKAATDMISAFTAMRNGGPDPEIQGTLAYNAMGSNKRVVPVIVFHGDSDYTVAPVNGQQVISQWAKTNDLVSENTITDTPTQTIIGQVPGGKSYTRYVYKDNTGAVIMEKYIVHGMGHAWSGGSSAGSYTDPGGPNASQIIYDFFMAHPKNGSTPSDDTTPPVTTPDPPGGTDDNHTITLKSIDLEDGYVGQLLADGYSTEVCKIGDKGMFNTDTYRTILSFDTSSIPPSAVIRNATLRIYRKSLTGTVNSLTVDIKNGYFGTSSGIELLDYNSMATLPGAMSMDVPNSNNEYVEATLPPEALAFLTTGNKIQFRIKAETNASFVANTLEVYGGNTIQYAPQLIISYE